MATSTVIMPLTNIFSQKTMNDNDNVNVYISGVRFNYRVVGVTIRDGRVLLQKDSNSDVWFLPGGRCSVNEDSAVALVREYAEEMNQAVQIVRPIFFFEYFYRFASKSENIHELSVTYLVDFAADSEVFKVDEFFGIEAGKKIFFKWFKLSELNNMTFYPELMRTKLLNIPDGFERLVYRDDKNVG